LFRGNAYTNIFASHLLNLFDWKSTGEASFVQFLLKKLKDNYQINLQGYSI